MLQAINQYAQSSVAFVQENRFEVMLKKSLNKRNSFGRFHNRKKILGIKTKTPPKLFVCTNHNSVA